MRKLLLIGLFFFFTLPVFADYNEKYQNYLIQFDLYRQKYSEFQVAKNEYKKYKTLTSQATALEKTKEMLQQRDEFLRAYLLTLYEKINDPDAGLQGTIKSQYQTQLANEIIFLETQASQISSIGSIDDAVDVSGDLESHYEVLSTSVRQILVGLSLGQLAIAAKHFDEMLQSVKIIVNQYQYTLSIDKQEIVKRWLLQIDTKRNFYQQKFDELTITNAQLDPRDSRDLETTYNQLMRGIAEARQYLIEGASFVTEVRDALKYVN